MDRRDFLRLSAFGAGAAAFAPLSGCAPDEPAVNGEFPQGIAAGLHSPTETVLWTRVDPRVSSATSLTWEVGTTPALTTVVASGSAAISAANDHCVKVLAGGLDPNTEYWYRFTVDGTQSEVGRTRTLPNTSDSVASLSLAIGNCQHYSAGYYAAWRQVAEQPVDAVLFLGDYIYEIGLGPLGVRGEPFTTALYAADYRARYRLYKSDPDLRAAHAAHPWMVIWDDHELWNDHDAILIAEQQARADAAHEAWFLYQPVWPIDEYRIYRSLRWGTLADLALIDTRQYRGEHLGEGLLFTEMTPQYADPARSILGAAQQQWLFDTLDAAQSDGAAWKVIGSQVMINPIRLVDLDTPEARASNPGLVEHAGLYNGMEGWSGFSAERDRVLDHIGTNNIEDVVVLTGDYHAFFQGDLRQDYDDDASPFVLSEFVVSSISSPTFNLPEQINAAANGGQVSSVPPLNYSNLEQNGWGLCRITPSQLEVTFFGCDARTGQAPLPIARWEVPRGSSRATRVPV